MDENKKSVEKGGRREGLRTRLFDRISTTPQGALRGLVAALIAFLFANCELPFSVYPLGLSLLCASTDKTLYIAAGLLAAAFTVPMPWAIPLSVTVGTLAVRIVARVFIDLPTRIGGDGHSGELRENLKRPMFCEGLYLRMACACVSVFAMSLAAIIRGGFQYYDLFGALLSMIVAPVATLLFAGLFEGEIGRLLEGKRARFAEHAAHVAVIVALCYSLDRVSLLGVSLSVVFAFVAVLVLCRDRGLAAAMIGGALCGLVIDPPYALMLAVSAFAAFCVQEKSHTLAAAVAAVAGTACGVAVLGTTAVGRVFLPLFFGMSLYSAADKLTTPPRREAAPVSISWREQMQAEQIREEREKAQRLAETLSELSSALLALSRQQRKPTQEELRLLCDGCFDELCASCPRKSACWDSHYHILSDAVDGFCATLAEDGRVETEAVPEFLLTHCPAVGRLTDRLNEKAAALGTRCRSAEAAEIFALDYAASASLLRELFSDADAAFSADEKNTAALLTELKKAGYTQAEVSVTGERQKRIAVRMAEGKTEPPYPVARMERACGFPLTAVSCRGGLLTARRAAAFDAVYDSGFLAGEKVCGDVVAVFRDEERGYLFALLNDGMGMGKDAAFTARLASLFLRKLLPAGVGIETAVRMLHHFLRLGHNRGSQENSTTVDLLALDLLEGRATFFKSGAAPTYIKRGKNVFYLDSRTAPVGILPEMDAKQIEIDVRDGDVIVMVSDGITDGDGECPWLADHLSQTAQQDPTELSRHILRDAAERGSADDLSAIVLTVRKMP